MAEPNVLTEDTFLNNLRELSDGLFYLSESDYPLEPVVYSIAAPASLAQEEILNLVGLPPESAVEVVDLPYFFRNMTAEQPEADEFMKTMTQRFRDLQAYLQQHLQDLKVYRIGKREIHVYILGKLNDTHFAGLKTVSVET